MHAVSCVDVHMLQYLSVSLHVFVLPKTSIVQTNIFDEMSELSRFGVFVM